MSRLALAFLLSFLALTGCGADFRDQVTDSVATGSRAPEFLRCGWARSHEVHLRAAQDGHLWCVTPGVNGAISLTDNACDAETEPLLGLQGDESLIVYEWAPLSGHFGPARVEYCE